MGKTDGRDSEGRNNRLCCEKTLNDIALSHAPIDRSRMSSKLSSFGTVESIKAVSELYAPLSGTVVSTNQDP